MKPNNLNTPAWQSISTAPKSGKRILLWWNCCEDPAVGRWEYDGIREGWRCEGDQCVPKNQLNCTHWMPLPEPPNGLVEINPLNVRLCSEADLRASLAAIHFNACRPQWDYVERQAHLLSIVDECERCIPALKGLRP